MIFFKVCNISMETWKSRQRLIFWLIENEFDFQEISFSTNREKNESFSQKIKNKYSFSLSIRKSAVPMKIKNELNLYLWWMKRSNKIFKRETSKNLRHNIVLCHCIRSLIFTRIFFSFVRLLERDCFLFLLLSFSCFD